MDQYSYNCAMMEKRQLFLRSYQFSRKRTIAERVRRSLTRAKRVVWSRLRSAHRLRKLVWARLFRLRKGFYYRRRSRPLSLLHHIHYNRIVLGQGDNNTKSSSSSPCFW